MGLAILGFGSWWRMAFVVETSRFGPWVMVENNVCYRDWWVSIVEIMKDTSGFGSWFMEMVAD